MRTPSQFPRPRPGAGSRPAPSWPIRFMLHLARRIRRERRSPTRRRRAARRTPDTLHDRPESASRPARECDRTPDKSSEERAAAASAAGHSSSLVLGMLRPIVIERDLLEGINRRADLLGRVTAAANDFERDRSGRMRFDAFVAYHGDGAAAGDPADRATLSGETFRRFILEEDDVPDRVVLGAARATRAERALRLRAHHRTT